MATTRKPRRPGYTAAPDVVHALAPRLLDWFAANRRDLPWRRRRDPYEIWVSEIMLQQTRVETVIPYWERWLSQFPTIHHLADAPLEQVLKAWEGLGYYSRARHLHRAAQILSEQHGGELPADPTAIQALPGVGSYTMGAIASIAFNLPVPAVDGNVLRVLSRICAIDDDIARPATRLQMEVLVQTLLPETPGDFNQALMELGALICTPQQPRCGSCPVAELCAARRSGRQAELPVKARARPPRPVELVAAVIQHQGRLLVEQRPPQGLLAGLWQFPQGERLQEEPWLNALHRVMGEQYGLLVIPTGFPAMVEHTFTHLRWQVTASLCHLQHAGPEEPSPGPTPRRWVSIAELANLPMATAHQRICQALALGTTQGGTCDS